LVSRSHSYSWLRTWYTLKFFSAAQKPNSGLGRLVFVVSRSQTIRYTRDKTWKCDRLVAKTATYNTQETNNQALGEIRTRNPSNKAASDLRLTSHDNRDCHVTNYCSEIKKGNLGKFRYTRCNLQEERKMLLRENFILFQSLDSSTANKLLAVKSFISFS
jgi:hypothetical protein